MFSPEGAGQTTNSYKLLHQGQSAAACQRQGCHSLCYESMRREIDFENITQGQKKSDMVLL